MISASRTRLAITLAAALASCGPSSTTGPRITLEGTVGAAGGTLAFADSALLLIFPAGALDTTITFTATAVTNSTPSLVSGRAFDIQPSRSFAAAVTVIVDYTGVTLPTGVLESELGIYRLQSNTWTQVPGTVVDATNDRVTTSVTSFSTYGLLGAPVASVNIPQTSPSVNVGATTTLTATAADANGISLPNRPITWQSLTPQLATVSQTGVVTGVNQGTAMIRALSESMGDTVGVTVNQVTQPPPPQVLATHDFNNQAIGPFWNPWGNGVDFPADPTGSGRGRVARISYAPASGSSMERAVAYTGSQLRYGGTIWFKGELYMPSAGANPTHNRKLIDYQGNGVRMTLHRRGTTRDLRLSIVDAMGSGVETETIAESTGLTLADDTWHTIEVRMTANSADGVRDGILEVYLNRSATPNYRRATNLGWITQNFGGGGSYFNTYLIGFQLTIDSGNPAYQEYRYWDNLTFSTTRLP